MQVSEDGLKFIKKWEAYRQFAYPDPYSPLARAYPSKRWGFAPAEEILKDVPANVAKLSGAPWTVGFGETSGVDMYSTRTKEEADRFLRSKVRRYEGLARANLKREVTQGQFDMLVSIAWNVESAVGASSSIIKLINKGDFEGASRAFRLYNKVRVNGKLVVSKGLDNRRAQESANFLAASSRHEEAHDDYPVESEYVVVEPERPMRSSEINQAATVGGVSIGAAGVSEGVRYARDIKENLETFGEGIPLILLVVGACAFGYMMYQRYRQRKEGWA